MNEDERMTSSSFDDMDDMEGDKLTSRKNTTVAH
jgi:hypothetical protein